MMVLRINCRSFTVPTDGTITTAVNNLASGAAFTETADEFSKSIDAVLGSGAMARILSGRRFDIFDRITLAVFICREYINRS